MPQLSLHSPVGDLTISEEDCEIVSLDWGWSSQQEPNDLLRRTKLWLDDYFDGSPDSLPADIILNPAGTVFCRRVWSVMSALAHGETISYGAVADQLNSSARAVGQACGKNPIPILIPCHRIVSKNGDLKSGDMGGYSGGDGPPTKLFLLTLET